VRPTTGRPEQDGHPEPAPGSTPQQFPLYPNQQYPQQPDPRQYAGPPGSPPPVAPAAGSTPVAGADQLLRTAEPRDLAEAAARIDLARWLRLIDADEHEGRLAHLQNVRRIGELQGVLDGIPPLAELQQRHATYVPPPVDQSGFFPGSSSLVPYSAPPSRVRRLPRTSPQRQDVPPPDVGIGPYGRQFERADPRMISHRMIQRPILTPWGMRTRLEVRKETNVYAVVSLVLAISGLFVCPPAAILGVAVGHWSLAQIKVSDRALEQGTVVAIGEAPQSGRAVALIGVIFGYLVIALYIVIAVVLVVQDTNT
jgi:hypothetical protein